MVFNFKLQTSNLKPQTSNDKPQTSNLKRQTSNLKPQTTNLKPQTSNLKPQTTWQITTLFNQDSFMTLLPIVAENQFLSKPYSLINLYCSYWNEAIRLGYSSVLLVTK